MNYLLLMHPAETITLDYDHQTCVEMCRDLVDGLVANGQFVAAGVLEQPSCARTIRLQQGHPIVTDGPFTETREQFAGYLLIQAESLEEATKIALRHPTAQSGAIELLPVKDVSFTATT